MKKPNFSFKLEIRLFAYSLLYLGRLFHNNEN